MAPVYQNVVVLGVASVLVCTGVLNYFYVPWKAYESTYNQTGFLFTGLDIFAMNDTTQVSVNSTWKDGWLVGFKDNDICGGIDPNWTKSSMGSRIDDDRANPKRINLCQTLNFSAGLGNLLLFVQGIPFLQGITEPALLMVFALPVRLYFLGILIPFCGTVFQVCCVCLVWLHFVLWPTGTGIPGRFPPSLSWLTNQDQGICGIYHKLAFCCAPDCSCFLFPFARCEGRFVDQRIRGGPTGD